MKHIITVIAACLLFATASFAQGEKLAPGIYAIVDSTVTHLSYTPGVATNSGLNVIGVELGNTKFTYKGESSEVKATGKFVMVIDPEKKGIRKTPKIPGKSQPTFSLVNTLSSSSLPNSALTISISP